MEKVTFKSIINNIKYTLDEIRVVKARSKSARHPGEAQKYRLRLVFLNKKLKAQKDGLVKMVNGTITKAIYQLTFKDTGEVKKFEQTFVNLNRQDIFDILKLFADLSLADIEILELKESPTQMREL